jgi:hypothetical protein
MTRYNPFNKDKEIIELEHQKRDDYFNNMYNEKHYGIWGIFRGLYYMFEAVPKYCYERNQASIAKWRELNGTPVRYHPKYPRVKRADQCETDDLTCLYEADLQMLRDRALEEEILAVMKQRFQRCFDEYDLSSHVDRCHELRHRYLTEADRYDTKYGDLAYTAGAIQVLNKQKHRMMLEREGLVTPDKSNPDVAGTRSPKYEYDQPPPVYPLNPYPKWWKKPYPEPQ